MGIQEAHNPPPAARPPNKRQRGLILAAACCGNFVGFGSIVVFTFSIFLKPLSASFGWNRFNVSLAFAVAALTVAFCSPFIGKLLDRYPARRIILPCVSVYGLAFASLGLLTAHLWHFIAVFVVLGIVGNGTTQLAYARVISGWFDAARGRALAAIMAGSGAGSMVFPKFAQWLISTYQWRTAYFVLGAIILVLGLPLTAAFFYESPGDSENKNPQTRAAAQTTPLLRSLLSFPFLCLAGGLVLFSMATNGLTEHFSPLLTDRGINEQSAATVLSLLGFSSLASRFITGYLLDRFFASRIVALLFLVCAGGMLLALTAHSVTPAALGGIFVGIGLGAESDAVPYLLSRYFSLQRFSELYAYTWSAYAIAGAMGPLIMGRAFDQTHSYDKVLLVFCGLAAIAAFLFAILPRYSTVAVSPVPPTQGF